MKKNYKGQILIVLMLALAIISVLLVIISRNVRRDSTDVFQSEQYEEYYSAVEQELLKLVSGQSPDCTLNDTADCEIDLDNLRFKDVLTNNKLYITKTEVQNFTDLVVEKDKSITIDLVNGSSNYDGLMKFSWKGEVAWVVNLDYQDKDGQYKTSQSVYDKYNILDGPAITCLTFTDDGANSFSFTISDCLLAVEPLGGYKTLSVRMKPLMRSGSSAELTLEEPTSDLTPQATIIVATADIDDDRSNAPAIQLELQIPTNNPSLEILDYALRTNKTVYKPKP